MMKYKKIVKGTHNDNQFFDTKNPELYKQERITVSYNSTRRHGHTNPWYAYVS